MSGQQLQQFDKSGMPGQQLQQFDKSGMSGQQLQLQQSSGMHLQQLSKSSGMHMQQSMSLQHPSNSLSKSSSPALQVWRMFIVMMAHTSNSNFMVILFIKFNLRRIFI
jgi:hypothetical protein